MPASRAWFMAQVTRRAAALSMARGYSNSQRAIGNRWLSVAFALRKAQRYLETFFARAGKDRHDIGNSTYALL